MADVGTNINTQIVDANKGDKKFQNDEHGESTENRPGRSASVPNQTSHSKKKSGFLSSFISKLNQKNPLHKPFKKRENEVNNTFRIFSKNLIENPLFGDLECPSTVVFHNGTKENLFLMAGSFTSDEIAPENIGNFVEGQSKYHIAIQTAKNGDALHCEAAVFSGEEITKMGNKMHVSKAINLKIIPLDDAPITMTNDGKVHADEKASKEARLIEIPNLMCFVENEKGKLKTKNSLQIQGLRSRTESFVSILTLDNGESIVTLHIILPHEYYLATDLDANAKPKKGAVGLNEGAFLSQIIARLPKKPTLAHLLEELEKESNLYKDDPRRSTFLNAILTNLKPFVKAKDPATPEKPVRSRERSKENASADNGTGLVSSEKDTPSTQEDLSEEDIARIERTRRRAQRGTSLQKVYYGTNFGDLDPNIDNKDEVEDYLANISPSPKPSPNPHPVADSLDELTFGWNDAYRKRVLSELAGIMGKQLEMGKQLDKSESQRDKRCDSAPARIEPVIFGQSKSGVLRPANTAAQSQKPGQQLAGTIPVGSTAGTKPPVPPRPKGVFTSAAKITD